VEARNRKIQKSGRTSRGKSMKKQRQSLIPMKRFEKRCTYCGAEVYSDSYSRRCYKCDNEMIVLRNNFSGDLK